MSLSPHQILASLADNERSKAKDQLAQLNRQRQAWNVQQQAAKDNIQKLIEQRQQVLQSSTQASMLMMMNDAMTEQQQCLVHIGQELNQLKELEATMLKQWITANQKCDTHEKMQRADEKRESRKQDHRVQQQMDDIFAGRKSREV